VKKCNNCGSDMEPDQIFCNNCGNRYVESPPSVKTMLFKDAAARIKLVKNKLNAGSEKLNSALERVLKTKTPK